jgi:hypothetical protein
MGRMKRTVSEINGGLKVNWGSTSGLKKKPKVMVQNRRTKRIGEILTKIMTLRLLGALIVWGL